MDKKKLALRSLLIASALVSSITSLVTTVFLIGFALDISNKSSLQNFIISFIISAILWGTTFYLANSDKERTREQKWAELKIIIIKFPLILLSTVITSVYVFIYFFLFSFVTVSEYGKGGMGGSVSYATLGFTLLALGAGIFGAVMYNVFKSDKQDMSLVIYNQFSILKWSSLIALPFGCWAAYYFYRNEGFLAWVAMAFYFALFYGIYKVCNRISEKVQNHITDANINRIIHEKKKAIINQNQPGV